MKVAELIEKRQPLWGELEALCANMGRKPSLKTAARFSTLYRAACADLMLAESYQLPPNTVDYLHRLVAKAHNQLYRSQAFRWQDWAEKIFVDTPRLIFNDPCVHIAAVVFWGLFLLAAFLAYENRAWPGFAENVLGEESLENFKDMYAGFDGRSGVGGSISATGFYVSHNAGIGLQCFVTMLLVIPGLVTLSYNAVNLGAVFGFMFRPELGESSVNFQNFVTAHGPFELTAIILSAGAGLKIGLGWLMTGGLSRSDSLLKTAREALPIAMCAVVLFILAALIEGFISPTSTGFMPWWVKGVVAVGSSCGLMIYFVVLGYPQADVRGDA
ncbi:MAG: stage II sporulation protein M [Mariniblastus sp.]|nr:stage II sporulation protein M [Mariniblastus sp.]